MSAYLGHDLYAAEMRRCIIELDVSAVRKIWAYIQPGLPQPEDDEDALTSLHMARLKAKFVPQDLKDYSRTWLTERRKPRLAHAVGIGISAVHSPDPSRRDAALDARSAMGEAVVDSVRAGVDLDREAEEVKSRMQNARHRLRRLSGAVPGFKLDG